MTDKTTSSKDTFFYAQESWYGESRDGAMEEGEGYHYLKMRDDGLIVEAYEVYEDDAGEATVSALPEMIRVHWLEDLGYEDFSTLEIIDEAEFREVAEAFQQKNPKSKK